MRSSRRKLTPHQIGQYLLSWRLSLMMLLALVLGGTASSVYALKVPLYFISLVFIVQAIWTRSNPFSALLRPPVILGGLLVLGFGLYLIPLPVSLWGGLSGRDIIQSSFELVHAEKPSMPLSLAPHATYLSAFNFLPIIAITLIMLLSAGHTEIKRAEKTIIFAAVLSLIIGIIDVAAKQHLFSVYEVYSRGLPTGIFPNINHQAVFMAVAMPLAIYYLHKGQSRGSSSNLRVSTLSAMAVIALILGVFLCRSTAGYGLSIVAISSALFIMNRKKKLSVLFLMPIILLAVAICIDLMTGGRFISPVLDKFSSTFASSRGQIYITSIEAAREFGIFGIGPGAFEAVYRIFENKDTISKTYINAVHNDYIQLYMEFGLLGIGWIVAGFIWYIQAVFKVNKSRSSRKAQYLIYALCLAILLIHSAVDYPLRTVSLSALFFFLVLRLDQFSAQRAN